MTEGTGKFAEKIRQRDSYWVERVKIDFAEELGRLMERRGVNRAELAQRIGTSAAYISKALRGDTNFTIESMVKLVRSLGGRLHLHISGEEDRVRWTDLLEFSGRVPAQSGEVDALFRNRPNRMEFRTADKTGAYGDVADTIAA